MTTDDQPDHFPPPPVPAECDLTGFPFMPLDCARLLDSDLFALSTGDEFKAAVALWCKSWAQVPTGSLTDDPRVLAHLAGVPFKRWKKIGSMALHGWTKASDGRLYHPVVSAKVAEAWSLRERQRDRGRRGNAVRWGSPEDRQRIAEGSPVGSLCDRKGQGQGQGQSTPPPNEDPFTPAAETPAHPVAVDGKTWMDFKMQIGRSRVFIDREGNSENDWKVLFHRAGWDEFVKAWRWCADHTDKPGGKVFLSAMLGVLHD